ncbi:MAG: GvpL/GvpF family gas vesicle protein [Myxococcales bacterium]|nr:GvpL/GvpF family gas vesicle protein [Myxococcales bacterium]
MTTHAAMGRYVYCISRGDAPVPEAPGIDEVSPVRALRRGPLAAVLSDVNLEEWTGDDAESRLADLEWLGPRALHHERVVEAVMRDAPVLPLRFGAMFSSDEAVCEWLARHEGAIARFLEAMRGAEEWSLRGWVDRDRCEEALALEDPRRATLSGSPGARYLAERRLRRDIAGAVGPLLHRLEEQLVAAIEARVLLHASLAPASAEMHGRSDAPAFNRACLVRAGEIDALRAALDDHADAWARYGVSIELTGPWPPYNFCPPLGAES